MIDLREFNLIAREGAMMDACTIESIKNDNRPTGISGASGSHSG